MNSENLQNTTHTILQHFQPSYKGNFYFRPDSQKFNGLIFRFFDGFPGDFKNILREEKDSSQKLRPCR